MQIIKKLYVYSYIFSLTVVIIAVPWCIADDIIRGHSHYYLSVYVLKISFGYFILNTMVWFLALADAT